MKTEELINPHYYHSKDSSKNINNNLIFRWTSQSWSNSI